MKSPSRFVLLSIIYSQSRRAAVWLPWLVAALLIAAALSPGMAAASRLAFQSPESPPPEPTATEIPPPPTQPPAPAATRAPAPKATQPPAPQATQPEAAPTPVPHPQATQPAQATATQSPPAQGTPPATGSPAPTVKATLSPAPSPTVGRTRTPTPEPENEATINWVKFWDTLVTWLAYPWMCCGVGLLLLVPVVLLYLEISGRRRPPLPPEIPPEQADEGFTPDEELNE